MLRNVRAVPVPLLARSRHLVERIDPSLANRLGYARVSNRSVQEILFRAEARLIQKVRAQRRALYDVLAEIELLLLRNVEATPLPLLARTRLLVERVDPALACRLDCPGVGNRMVQEIVFRAEARFIRRKRSNCAAEPVRRTPAGAQEI